MTKDAYYFSHDYNARGDEKIIRLLKSKGWEYYGLYWAIVEKLHEAGGWLELDLEALAYDLRTNIDSITDVIRSKDLFKVDGNKFTTDRVLMNIAQRLDKSQKAREAIQIRWNKEFTKDTNVIRPYYECNTRKERKGKESIVSKPYSKKPPKSALFSDFFNLHLHYTNQKYISTNESKDIAQLNKLVYELGDDEVRARLERFFKSDNKFILENGHSVGIFYSQINFLNEKTKKGKMNDLN